MNFARVLSVLEKWLKLALKLNVRHFTGQRRAWQGQDSVGFADCIIMPPLCTESLRLAMRCG